MEKSVYFPLKIPKRLDKFQKIGVRNAKCKMTENDGRNTLNVCQGPKGGLEVPPPTPILEKNFSN